MTVKEETYCCSVCAVATNIEKIKAYLCSKECTETLENYQELYLSLNEITEFIQQQISGTSQGYTADIQRAVIMSWLAREYVQNNLQENKEK